MITTDVSLKPCPFCGSVDLEVIVSNVYVDFTVLCNACGASSGGYPDEEVAVDAWNRRV